MLSESISMLDHPQISSLVKFTLRCLFPHELVFQVELGLVILKGKNLLQLKVEIMGTINSHNSQQKK